MGCSIGIASRRFWDGVTIVYDEVTKAATGEIVLTAVMLANFAVLRADGYTRRAFKLAA